MNLEKDYESITYEVIDNYILNRQEENLQLEFKTVNKPNLDNSEDKKNLAKVLSGFANSSCGIVIWGVATEKNGEQDCASDKREIRSLSTFMSRINEFTGKAVQPLVEGVKHKHIDIGNDSGFAVSLVPASDSGPHMAKFSEDRYYKRSGDSFYKMEHFDIEDMFGRRKKPKLFLSAKVDSVFNPGDRFRVYLSISLVNLGRGSARAPFLQMTKPNEGNWSKYGYDGNENFGLNRVNYHETFSTVTFSGDADKMIHPNVSLDITCLSLWYPKENTREHVKNCSINYKTAALDLSLNESILEISKQEILKGLKSHNVDV